MGTQARLALHGQAIAQASSGSFFEQHGHTRVPRLVQWLVTSRCPLSCPHCLAVGPGGPELNLAQAEQLIDQVARIGVAELLLTGGEPLARPDFPDLVGLLGERGVNWSLNTAIKPPHQARRAMEAHPPGFVAVSLDGPQAVHDAFRGREGAFSDALWAMDYYGQLASGRVAAGTTLTSLNVDHLEETFPLVLASGASSWGLHLLLPEGRAATQHDLDLSQADKRRLLRFVAHKREYFPVQMADELGYCGPWEPLVRDEPFFCGAGRAGCVVLPDGEVVPCTTMDRSTSAGNVTSQGLDLIWRDGFAPLRNRTPAGKCSTCEHSQLCGGGCWLLRRRGEQCAQTIWQTSPRARAAGLALLVGVAGFMGPKAEPAQAREPELTQEQTKEELRAQKMQVLQSSIVQWYASRLRGRRAPSAKLVLTGLRNSLPQDPGAKYFLSFVDGKRPVHMVELSRQIKSALTTDQRSLCLIGLFFRDMVEWSLRGGPPEKRSAKEQQALTQTLTLLGQTAQAWRQQVFEEKLDPFLRRPREYRRFLISKAGPTALQRVQGKLARSRGYRRPDLSAEFLKVHQHAESMVLEFLAADDSGLRFSRLGKTVANDCRMQIFDLLLTPAYPVSITFAIKRQTMTVILPARAQLAYGDVLRLLYEQNQPVLDKLLTFPYPSPPRSPLLLPALLKAQLKMSAEEDRRLHQVQWLLTDLYLF